MSGWLTLTEAHERFDIFDRRLAGLIGAGSVRTDFLENGKGELVLCIAEADLAAHFPVRSIKRQSVSEQVTIAAMAATVANILSETVKFGISTISGRKKSDVRRQNIALSIPKSLLERIKDICQEYKWSRSESFLHILDAALIENAYPTKRADDPGIEYRNYIGSIDYTTYYILQEKAKIHEMDTRMFIYCMVLEGVALIEAGYYSQNTLGSNRFNHI